MIFKNKIIVISIYCLTFFSCKEEMDLEYTIVQTGDVTEIDETGVVFQGEITNYHTNNLTDYGFVWDIIETPTYESSYSKSLGIPANESFSTKINSLLTTGQEYYVRAYIKSDNQIIYGRSVSFISQGSNGNILVTGFSPKHASWGDTISISHKNINYKKGETAIFIDSDTCHFVSINDSIIKILVPYSLSSLSSKVSVSISDSTWELEDYFTLSSMTIKDYTPKEVTFRDTIQISGVNFNPKAEYMNVQLNGSYSKILSSSDSSLVIIVSDSICTSEQGPYIKIFDGELSCSSNEELIIASPIIDSYSPSEVDRSDTLIITGENFNPTADLNTVYLGDIPADIISATTTELITNIPDGVVHGENTLTVKVADISVSADETIFIYEPWKQLNDFPGNARYYAFAFTADDRAYVGGGWYVSGSHYYDCYEYSPEDDSWEQKADIDDSNMLGFEYNNESYRVENNKLYKYNSESDTKELISTCSNLNNASFQSLFIHYNMVYLIDNNHSYGDLWTYSFTSNNWSTEAIRLSYINAYYPTIFKINDEVFLIEYDDLYEFNFSTNDFEEVMSLSNNDYLKNVYTMSTFVIDNTAYIIGGHNNQVNGFKKMAMYNLDSNTITNLTNPPFKGRTAASAFCINGKGYYGLGINNGTNFNDIWEFDPSKMKPE